MAQPAIRGLPSSLATVTEDQSGNGLHLNAQPPAAATFGGGGYISVPAGYRTIAYGGTGTITGQSGMPIAGSLDAAGRLGSGLTADASGTTGTTVLTDSVGGSSVTVAGNTQYSNTEAALGETLVAASGSNVTVLAQAGVDYQGAAADTAFIVDSSSSPVSGAMTVSGAANTTIWAGAAGGSYSIGSSRFFLGATWVAASTISDRLYETSLSGGGNANFYAYSNSNEALSLTSLPGAAALGLNLVALGNNTTVDAANSAGNDTIWMEAIASGSFGNTPATGAATIIGATAGHEIFGLIIDNAVETAHTITIENYQATDQFLVENVSGTNPSAYLANDVAAIDAFNAGSATSFTLSNGTTVLFQNGVHPTVTLGAPVSASPALNPPGFPALPGAPSNPSNPGGSAGDVLWGIFQEIQAAAGAGALLVSAPSSVSASGTAASPILIPVPGTQLGGTLQYLEVPDTDQGHISVPAGFSVIVYHGTGTITAQPGQQVAGALNVTGGAATVVATGGIGRVTDTASGAELAIMAGNYTVNSQGDAQTVDIGNAAKFVLNITGSGTHVSGGSPAGGTDPNIPQLRGTDFTTVAGTNTAFTMVSQENANFTVASGATGTEFTMTGGAPAVDVNTIFVVNGNNTTIHGGSGNLIVYDSLGSGLSFDGTGNAGNIFLLDSIGGGSATLGANTQYYNTAAAAAETLVGAAGSNLTSYALAGVDYEGSNANAAFLAGNSGSTAGGAMTVSGAANTTIWAGAAGGSYSIGGTSFFLGTASAATGSVPDKLYQTSLSGGGGAFFAYSNSHEDLSLTSLPGATASGMNLAAAGDGTTIDASGAAGHNTLWLFGIARSGTSDAVTGAATILGATAGHDTFSLFIDNTIETAHTISIENYQASDQFLLLNANGTGEAAYLPQDVAAIQAFNAGSGNSFTLHDGTTVAFLNGMVPHNVTLF